MRWLAAVAVAAIVGLLFFALRSHAPGSRATAREERESVPAEPRPGAKGNDHIFISKELGGSGMPADDEAPERDAGPERRPDPPWEEGREESPAPAERSIKLSGTLSVEGEAGAHSGRFVVGWTGPFLGGDDSVEVRAGAWSAVVPARSTLTFHDIRLGGRLAVAVDSDVPVPASGRVTRKADEPY